MGWVGRSPIRNFPTPDRFRLPGRVWLDGYGGEYGLMRNPPLRFGGAMGWVGRSPIRNFQPRIGCVCRGGFGLGFVTVGIG